VKILPPSLSPETEKVEDFYAARSRIIPPLPWPTIALPFSQAATAERTSEPGAQDETL
jgi:hypothetical protein